jgi:hypothetical protein
MKSSSSAGPRSPALSEFWLSPTGTPWLVVSTWPPASVRAWSSEPAPAAFPSTGATPVLADALTSLSVLADAASDGGSTVCPAAGATALSRPNSLLLMALCGIAAASA